MLHGTREDLKGRTGRQWEAHGNHSFGEFADGDEGRHSSPLNSLLRSSEGRFLRTVLEGEAGE